MAHVRRGDVVEVTSGKYKGKRGRVVKVLVDANRVCVEGVALVKRHLAPNRDPKNQEGGIIEKLGSVHISNVSPICPKTDKPTRVGSRRDGEGRKIRIARRSGEEIQRPL